MVGLGQGSEEERVSDLIRLIISCVSSSALYSENSRKHGIATNAGVGASLPSMMSSRKGMIHCKVPSLIITRLHRVEG